MTSRRAQVLSEPWGSRHWSHCLTQGLCRSTLSWAPHPRHPKPPVRVAVEAPLCQGSCLSRRLLSRWAVSRQLLHTPGSGSPCAWVCAVVSAIPEVVLGWPGHCCRPCVYCLVPEAQPSGPSTLVCRQERTGVFWTQGRPQVRGHGERTGSGERNKILVKEDEVSGHSPEVTVIECEGQG